MRLAYVCADPGVPVFGSKGCSVHVQEVCRALHKAGADLHLLATRLGGDVPTGLEGVAVHPLPPAPKGDLAARERALLAANDAIRATLETAGPFEFVYERFSLWSAAGMEFAAAAGVPGILEVNAPLVDEQADHRGLADRATAEAVQRRAFHAASAVVAVSEGVADYVRRAAPDCRIEVVPNAVDPARFRASDRYPRADGRFTVGFVGTMKPWHGVLTLVDAFALLRERTPEAHLLLVGDGTARGEVEAAIAARGLGDAVEMTGAVPPADVPALLSRMDVGVAPYPAIEGFYFSPLKLYEYMAAGLPVVSSRIAPIERVVRDYVDGLLATPGDAAALAGVLSAVAADPALAARLGRNARVRVARDHTWDGVARRILALAAPSRDARAAEPSAAATTP